MLLIVTFFVSTRQRVAHPMQKFYLWTFGKISGRNKHARGKNLEDIPVCENKVALSLRPFEIKTLRVTY
mgnify:CR=1 FL=1